MLRFLVGDDVGSDVRFSELEIVHELHVLGVPYEPSWADNTMSDIGLADGDASTCTARRVWERMLSSPRKEAMCAIRDGFLGVSDLRHPIAPVAAMIQDWTMRQRQLILCHFELHLKSLCR